jgi:hypothetical protein
MSEQKMRRPFTLVTARVRGRHTTTHPMPPYIIEELANTPPTTALTTTTIPTTTVSFMFANY